MIKKFFYFALAGAMLFTSCLKDEESASVKDLRSAKAEELRSVATLNKAQAEAATTIADAQAALAKAQAEYQAALAAGKTIDNEYYAKKYAEELKQLQAETEVALLKAQAELIQAQIDLQAKADAMDDAAATRLSKLYTAYYDAQTAYLAVQKALVDNQVLLAQHEDGLITLQELKAKQIAINNEQIAIYEQALKEYEEYAGMTSEELAEAIYENNKELLALTEAKNLSGDKKTAASTALTEKTASVAAYKFDDPTTWTDNSLTSAFSSTHFRLDVSRAITSEDISYKYYDTKKADWIEGEPFVSVKTYETKNAAIEVEGKAPLHTWTYKVWSPVKVLDKSAPDSLVAVGKKVFTAQYQALSKANEKTIAVNAALVDGIEAEMGKFEEKTAPLYAAKKAAKAEQDAAEEAYDAAENALTNFVSTNNAEINKINAELTKVNSAISAKESIITTGEANKAGYESQIWDTKVWMAQNYGDFRRDSVEYVQASNIVKVAEQSVSAQQKKVDAAAKDMDAKQATYGQVLLKYLALEATKAELDKALNDYDTAYIVWYFANEDLKSKQSDLEAKQGTQKGWKDLMDAEVAENEQYSKNIAYYQSKIDQIDGEMADATSALEVFYAKKAELDAALAAENEKMDDTKEGTERKKLIDDRNAKKAAYVIAAEDYQGVKNTIIAIEGTSGSFTVATVDGYETINYTGYADLKAKKETKQGLIDDANENQAEITEEYDQINHDVEDWCAAVLAATADEAAYAAEVEELNKLEVALSDATKEDYIALDNYNAASATKSALSALGTEYKAIKDAIEDLKAANADITAITSKEEAIADLKNKIAIQESELVTKKKLADDAYAALQAALKED